MVSNAPHVNNICLPYYHAPHISCSSEDGSLLVVGSMRGTISLISLINGRLIRLMTPGHERSDRDIANESCVKHLVLSSDGSTLYSSCSYEIKIWDVVTLKCLKKINIEGVEFIGYIDDQIYAGYTVHDRINRSSKFNIINLETEDITHFKDNEKGYIKSIVLSKDSNHIVTVRKKKDGTNIFNILVVWSVSKKKVVDVIEHRTSYQLDLVPFVNEGLIFYSAKNQKFSYHQDGDDIYIYEIPKKTTQRLGLQRNIASFDISFDQRYLLLINDNLDNSVVQLVDMESSETLAKFETPQNKKAKHVKFLCNSYNFSVFGHDFIKSFSFPSINDKIEISIDVSSNTSCISCAAISHNTKRIVICYKNKIKLYKAKSGTLLKTIEISNDWHRKWVNIESINFTLDDKYILIRLLRSDPYKDSKSEVIGFKLKNYKKLKNDKLASLTDKTDIYSKHHTSGNISIKLVNSTLIVLKNSMEEYTIHNFIDDDYVSMKPNGKFVANDEAIKKYIFCNAPCLIPKELSFEEINHFRKYDTL